MPRSVAIVLEWENVLLAGIDRSRRMLAQLNRQVPEYAAARGVTFELLVISNPEEVDPAIPRSIVPEHLDVARWPGRIEYLQAPGLHYFEQKNFGAENAQSEIVLFVDSDVIPEDGWLAKMLSQFDDPRAEIVAGCTYLDSRTVLERCFSLFWFFPPRVPRAEIYDSNSFFANNVAFRRELFLANTFPVAESFRGQGLELASRLLSKGYKIRRHGEAWVNHPSPNGFRHALVRAIVNGHDTVYWNRRLRRGWITTSPVGALGRFARDGAIVVKRAIQRRRPLRASLPLAFLAVAMGVSFRFVVMLAEFTAFVSPGLIRRNFSI